MTSTKSLRELITLNFQGSDITEKQLNIIIAAIELFAEKGYEATSTSEIAKRANAAEGTIFRHYKTKKDVLMTIPDILYSLSSMEIFFDEFNKVLNSKYETFERFLTQLVLNRKSFIAETSPLIKILIQEAPFHPELRDKFVYNVLFPSLDKFTSVIDKFKDKDMIIDMPSNTLVEMIFSSVFGFLFFKYILTPQTESSEEEINSLIQYIVNAITKK